MPLAPAVIHQSLLGGNHTSGRADSHPESTDRQAQPLTDAAGLRGVGKTVELNKIEGMAEAAGHVTSPIEAPEEKPLSELLVPKINQALRKLSIFERARARVHQALRALRSFASTFSISYGDASISVDPEAGVADSGDMEADLPELFVRVGEAAKAAGKAWTLLIDEVQYLRAKDLAALIVSLHRVNQKSLPVLFFWCGAATGCGTFRRG